jgi:hypothetical protein
MLKKATIHRVVAASLAVRINQVFFIPVISKSLLKSYLDQLMVLADHPPHEEEGDYGPTKDQPETGAFRFSDSVANFRVSTI